LLLFRWYKSHEDGSIKHTSDNRHCPSRQGYEVQQAEQAAMKGKAYKILVRKPVGKPSLRRLKDVGYTLLKRSVRMFS
jgi:hypothetical protein